MAGEGRLWEKLRPRLVEDFFVDRIENLVGEGIPDVHLISRHGGMASWVELKSKLELPKRSTTRVFGDDGLRPMQVAWLHSRGSAGARVWILAQAGGWLILVHGMWAKQFNDATFGQLIAMSTWSHEGRLTDRAYNGLFTNLMV